MKANPAFFNLLASEKILTKEDSQKLLDKYDGNALLVMKHLVNGNISKKEVLGKLWGDSIGVAYVDLNKTLFQSDIINRLPKEFAKKHHIIPLYQIDQHVTLAAETPTDKEMIDEAEIVIGSPVSAVFSFAADIEDAIEIQYQSDSSVSELVNRIADNALFKGTTQITSAQLQKLVGDKFVIELTRVLILLAIKERASDIHIEPQEDVIRIRYRIDGLLQDRIKLEKTFLLPLLSRLKIMASLDITEKRRPQDGRITLELPNKSVDVRISTMPNINGEKIVLRILGQIVKNEVPSFSDMNFSKSILTKINKVIRSHNGIFFITGPTGSGKTTTLFSCLNSLNIPEVNIVTIEDPVEYRLAGISQTQANPDIGLDFATALRSFLRQDPDIILIGEIRDLETARIASRAALTGHLVLATMHTNDALQAITRLVEIGVEPFLVGPSIISVMSQRLVRRICEFCKEKYLLSKEEIEKYFVWDNTSEVFFYRGKGCHDCHNTGYSGRIGIHEIFNLTEEVKTMVAQGASIMDIKKTAITQGFKDMRYDGLKKVLRGLTTIDELERVTTAAE